MSGPHRSLIEALQDAALYDHPVESFRLIETHISWVLLTGQYAYKIKKPVDLGFVDFSTLDKRRFYCEEELRLNRRLAPSLYLGVIAITGSLRQPHLGGEGEPVEYAVKMAQFDTSLQFDRLLGSGRLTPDLLACFANGLARFHASAARSGPQDGYGEPAAVLGPIRENFAQIHLPKDADAEVLHYLRQWSEQVYQKLSEALARRKAGGFVRECHGDLHLGNIVLYDGHATAFDCLEFNPDLRWIDVMNEVAFLAMDLDEHRRPELALRFLNEYLHHTGDYGGLTVLRFYQVYRAMVRAKVECIRADQRGGDEESIHALLDYLRLARSYTRAIPRALIVTHGLSGSGKTTIGTDLLSYCGAIRLRSDVERKRLAGLPPDARTHAAVGGDLYGRTAGERTYRRLAELATEVIGAGFPVMVDATFLRHQQREDFRQLAARLRVPFLMLDFRAPEPQLVQRIRDRGKAGRDASEADLAVLRYQQATQESLSAEEAATAIPIDTSIRPDIGPVVKLIRERMAV